MSYGLYDSTQGHLQSLVDLRQLVDGVIGDNGHRHSIDGKKLGQAVSLDHAGSVAPDSGVDIVCLLQVSHSQLHQLPCQSDCYLHLFQG